MFNHVVYDVFIKNEDSFKDKATGLRGMSRFGSNCDAFTAKGLEFRYYYCTHYHCTLRGPFFLCSQQQPQLTVVMHRYLAVLCSTSFKGYPQRCCVANKLVANLWPSPERGQVYK